MRRWEPRFVISKGDWQRRTSIVQHDESELGCWAHGIVHMIEGDLGNARTGTVVRTAHSRTDTDRTAEIAALKATLKDGTHERAAELRAAGIQPEICASRRFPTTSASGCRRRRTSGSGRCCSTP